MQDVTPAAQAVAASVLLSGGEDALDLVPAELASAVRGALGELKTLDRTRRSASLARSVAAALRPTPSLDATATAALGDAVPALGPALRALGVPSAAGHARTRRAAPRDVLDAIAAAVGPETAPRPDWCPDLDSVPACGIRLLSRAVADLDARDAAALCGRLPPNEAEALVAARRTNPHGDPEVARRILSAASRDEDPSSLALRVGAYRIGYALGLEHDAPAGWPAAVVRAVRRGQAVAGLTADERDGRTEREALRRERDQP